MTYRLVFDISDRYRELALGAVAVAVLLAFGLFLIVPRGRGLARRWSWLVQIIAALLLGLFTFDNVGGPNGLWFGGTFAVVGCVAALLAGLDIDLDLGDRLRIRARTWVPLIAAAMLGLAGLQAIQETRALDLDRRLTSGDASVVEGSVQDSAGGGSWGWQCFTVSGQRFCYGDDASSVGFHQTTLNGGPIHDGLQVRVTSIDGVIVRLEIASVSGV